MKTRYGTTAVFLLIIISIQGCDIFEPTATVSVIEWEQEYYTYSEKWSSVVEVWYKIRNTGSIDIDYYKIWFTATCTDGTTYEDWTNGLGLDTGHAITDSTYISVPGKRVQGVRVTDYELSTW